MTDVAREPEIVLGRPKPASRVAARSFQHPRRLGPERALELERQIRGKSAALEKKLAELAGSPFELELERIDEVDAQALFAGAVEPLCVLRFRAPRGPGWLVVEPAEAVALVESLFGARGASGTKRALSPAESRVAKELLSEVARSVGAALDVAVADLVLVQVASELGSWQEGGEGAQPHRLALRLRLARGELRSTLVLYLPGIAAADPASSRPLPERLPAHLERVEVEVSARLPGCEISLDQLLALEAGDVIPLDARLGDSTALCVEGLTLARGRLGSHRGRLAVRIESLSPGGEAAA